MLWKEINLGYSPSSLLGSMGKVYEVTFCLVSNDHFVVKGDYQRASAYEVRYRLGAI